jgi:hypothetical protein
MVLAPLTSKNSPPTTGERVLNGNVGDIDPFVQITYLEFLSLLRGECAHPAPHCNRTVGRDQQSPPCGWGLFVERARTAGVHTRAPRRTPSHSGGRTNEGQHTEKWHKRPL